jgi:predicted nucleic acid-binding protein
MAGSSWLVDTNVLLRLVQPDSPEYGTIRRCTDVLWAHGAELFYTFQNLAEFWNVCTRPAERNGFGFSVEETDERANLIESKFTLAADSEATYREWRRIVVLDGVSGIQVHDARLVAVMHVHAIE